MSGALSGSADPNIARSAPPPEEQFVFPDEQGGNARRAELNITKQSSIDQAIASGYALGGKQYGREETKPGQPTLESPLWSLRANIGKDPDIDTGWQDQMNALTESLPKQLLNDPAFADFLKIVAKGMDAAEKASKPFEADGVELTNAAKGNQIAQNSILSTLVQTNMILHEGGLFLKSVGAADPEFDTLSRLINDTQAITNRLSTLTRRDETGTLNSHDKTELNDIVRQINNMQMAMQTTSATEKLQILAPTLNTLLLASNLLLSKPGEQLALITTTLASIALREGDNPLVGNQLNALSNKFSNQAHIDSKLLNIGLISLLAAGAYMMQAEPSPKNGEAP